MKFKYKKYSKNSKLNKKKKRWIKLANKVIINCKQINKIKKIQKIVIHK